MAQPSSQIDVYLEIGSKRTFAGAVEWPGWCRSGRDEEAALLALFEYAPRYESVLRATDLGFCPPAEVSALVVVERLEGNATTEFGAPDVAPAGDSRPVDEAELERLQALLKACWASFDLAVREVAGRELRKGPRGGGRELDGVVQHVLGAEASYLTQLGGKLKKQDREAGPGQALALAREAILDTLAAAARGEVAAYGPRGGKRWPPRYFVRRAAWHLLDHVWELEDRAL